MGLFVAPSVFAGNLHLIDQNEETGFALYRMGMPSRSDVRGMCALGIQEIMVLSGDAQKSEWKYREECPTLKVVFNSKQDETKPLNASFLRDFDRWVTEARSLGKKIAFRCFCGCHRTGRLAAYYQMKYQNLSVIDAKIIMNTHGEWMLFHPQLDPQVSALQQYIAGKPCTYGKHCVQQNQNF